MALSDFTILQHGPGQEDAPWPFEAQLYFARQIEAEVRKEDEALIRQMRNALFALPLPYSSETRAALQAGNDWLDAAIKGRARLGTNPPPGPNVPKPEA